MVILWLYYGNTMVILWLYYGNTMVILWLYYGNNMVILWFYTMVDNGHAVGFYVIIIIEI